MFGGLARTGLTVANETYDVFVSYSRADWRHAAEIDSVLRAKGLRSFFDRRNLAPGLPWVRALEQAIGAAKAVIVLIGPRGLGNTQQYERELALVRQSRDPAFPIVPVILPDTTTDRPFDFLQAPHLDRFLSRRESVRRAGRACAPLGGRPRRGRAWGGGAGSHLPLSWARRLPGRGRRVLLRPRQRRASRIARSASWCAKSASIRS